MASLNQVQIEISENSQPEGTNTRGSKKTSFGRRRELQQKCMKNENLKEEISVTLTHIKFSNK